MGGQTSCFTLSLSETSGILRISFSVTGDPVTIVTMMEEAVCCQGAVARRISYAKAS